MGAVAACAMPRVLFPPARGANPSSGCSPTGELYHSTSRMSIVRFGEKLRALRHGHRMSQRELAAAIGIAAHSYINALETGKKKPTIELVMQLAKLFGVSADQLLDDALDLDLPDAGDTAQ